MATCLLTQAAFVRLSCNPAVNSLRTSPAEAAEMLSRFVQRKEHVFREAKKSAIIKLVEILDRCHAGGQVNDAFLLWLRSHPPATL